MKFNLKAGQRPISENWLDRIAPCLFGGLVIVLTFLCFAPTLNFQFLNWDDDLAITHNPIIRSINWENFQAYFFDKKVMWRFMPFTFLSWALLHSYFGLNPLPFHFANVFFHSVSALFLFLTFRELVIAQYRRVNREAAEGVGLTFWVAAGALLWSVHPLRVEVVARASNLTYCTSTAFLFAALYFYLRSMRHAEANPRAELQLYFVSLSCFGISLFFYGLGISVPGLILLLHFYFSPGEQKTLIAISKSGARIGIPLLLITLFTGLMNYSAHFHPVGAWSHIESFQPASWSTQLGRAAYISVYFLVKCFLPFNLMPANPTLLDLRWPDQPLYLSLVLVFAVSALLWWKRREWQGVGLLWLAYLILVIPVLAVSVERLPFLCDRHSHLVSAVWAFASIQLFLWLRENPALIAFKRFWAPLFAGLPIIYGSASLPQSQIWENSITLFEYSISALKRHPYRFDFYPRLAEAYMQEEKPFLAIPLLKEAIARLQAPSPVLLAMLGNAYQTQGMWQEAEVTFRQLIPLMPRMENYRALALAQFQLGKSTAARATIATALNSTAFSDLERKELHDFLRETLRGKE